MEENTGLIADTAYISAMLTLRTSTIVALMLLISCNQEAPEPRARKIAAAYCECNSRLANLNRQARSIQKDTNRQAEFSALLSQMAEEHTAAKGCATAILTQYGKLSAIQLDSVQQALKTVCPDMADQQNQLREMLGE